MPITINVAMSIIVLDHKRVALLLTEYARLSSKVRLVIYILIKRAEFL